MTGYQVSSTLQPTLLSFSAHHHPTYRLSPPHVCFKPAPTCCLRFRRLQVQAQHEGISRGFSPRAGTSFKLTGCWQTHCLVDENLRSPFPPLLTARDRSQLLESPYSSCPHGSMGSSHMDVYFLPSWRESLCLPLLQLVEKTVCFQRA